MTRIQLKKHLITSMSIVVMGLSGCFSSSSNDSSTTVTPLSGDIVVNHSGKDKSKVKVLLNRRDITSLVTFINTQGSAKFVDVKHALIQGTNTVSVTEPGQPASSKTFIFDDQGPDVAIHSAIKNGSSLNVTGIVTDPSGVASLQINDQAVNFDDKGAFSTTINASNAYLITAEDKGKGLKSAVKYLPAGSYINPTIRTSIEESLISSISPVIAGGLNVTKDETPEIWDAINPLAELTVANMNIDVNLTSFESQRDNSGNYTGTSSVTLSVTEEATSTIAAEIKMIQPLIGVTLNIKPTDGSASSTIVMHILPESLHINTANIALDTDDEENFSLKFVDKMPVDLTGTRVEVRDAQGQSNALFSNPITNLIVANVTDMVEGIIADALPGVLNNEISARLQDLFLGINTDDDNLTFKLGITDFSTSGSQLITDLSSAYATKNAVNKDNALGIRSVVPADTTLSTLSETTLPAPKSLGLVNTAISFDFINQALLLAYETGMMNINMINGVMVPADELESVSAAAQDGQLWVAIKPSLPNLTLFNADDKANAAIDIDNLELTVQTRRSGNWSSLFTTAVSANMVGVFGFDAAKNAVVLGPSKIAPKIVVKDSRIFNLPLIPIGLVNGLIDMVTPALADTLAAVELPLPIPAELPVTLKDISTLGSENNHLNLSLDLDLFKLAEFLMNNQSSTTPDSSNGGN
ncbi:MAG: hypothetical protein AAGF06_05735 [Pseudomonadota bacterium]